MFRRITQKLLNHFFLIVLIFGVSGCINSNDAFFINPDGSGKVVHQAVIASASAISFGAESGDKTTRIIKDELEKAEGVDAWSDISYEVNDAGDIEFKATAYFRDVNRLKLHNGGVTMSALNIAFESLDDGKMTLKLVEGKKNEMGVASQKDYASMTDDEISQEIKMQTDQFNQMKPMMQAAMMSTKMTKSFHLPGSLKSMMNFTENDQGAWEVTASGQDYLALMEEVFADEERLKKMLLDGRDPMKDGITASEMNEKVFGTFGPVEVVMIDALEPLFNYEKEVAVARVESAAFLEKLGVIQKEKILSQLSGDVSVGGVRLIYVSDHDAGIMPFNSFNQGYALSLIAKLDEEATKITGGTLLSAVADNGEDLILTDKTRIYQTSLSEDKKMAIFDVELAMPSASVEGI